MRIEMTHIQVCSKDEQRAYYLLKGAMTCSLSSMGLMVKSTDLKEAKSILERALIIHYVGRKSA